jgi:hypothetical protein
LLAHVAYTNYFQAVLKDGKHLKTVLADYYTVVFFDERYARVTGSHVPRANPFRFTGNSGQSIIEQNETS